MRGWRPVRVHLRAQARRETARWPSSARLDRQTLLNGSRKMRFRYSATYRDRLLQHSPTRRLGTVYVNIQLLSQPVVRSGIFAGVSPQLLVALAVAAVALVGNMAEATTISNPTPSAAHDQAIVRQLPTESLPSPLKDLGNRLFVCRMDHELTQGYFVRGPSFASVYWDRPVDEAVTGDSDRFKYFCGTVEGDHVAAVGNGGFWDGYRYSSSSGRAGSNDEVDNGFYSSGCRIDIGPPVPIYREPQFVWIDLTNYEDWHATIERDADLERRPRPPRCRVFVTRQPIGALRSAPATATAAGAEAAGFIELPRRSSPLPPPFIWAAAASRLLLLGRSCDGQGGVDGGADSGRSRRRLQVSLGLVRGLSACHVARVGAPTTLDHRAALIAQDPRYDALLLPHHQPCLNGSNYTLRIEPVRNGDRQLSRSDGVDYNDRDYDHNGRRRFDIDVQATVVPDQSSCRRLCIDRHCLTAAGMHIQARSGALHPVTTTIRYETLSPATSGCDPEAFVGFVVMVRSPSRIVVVT